MAPKPATQAFLDELRNTTAPGHVPDLEADFQTALGALARAQGRASSLRIKALASGMLEEGPERMYVARTGQQIDVLDREISVAGAALATIIRTLRELENIAADVTDQLARPNAAGTAPGRP